MMEELKHKISLFLKSKINDDQLIADLSQEALLRLVKYEKEASIENREAFCIRVARNLLIDHHRKTQRTTFVTEELVEDSSFDKEVLEEMVSCQERYIHQLDEESKFLIEEIDIQNKSQKQLAETLQIPYPSLRSKVQRARKKIKDQFDQECIIEFDSTGQVISCERR